MLSGAVYPGLELEKHLQAFEPPNLESLAFEKQDKQTWAQEGTHSPFFPLPFKLIKVKFSELCCLTGAFQWVSLFYLLCLSQVQAAWRVSGQQRPLSGSVDISGDVKALPALGGPEGGEAEGCVSSQLGLSEPSRPVTLFCLYFSVSSE